MARPEVLQCGEESQRGSGADPPARSRTQCDKRSTGGGGCGYPLVLEIFFFGSVQIS